MGLTLDVDYLGNGLHVGTDTSTPLFWIYASGSDTELTKVDLTVDIVDPENSRQDRESSSMRHQSRGT